MPPSGDREETVRSQTNFFSLSLILLNFDYLLPVYVSSVMSFIKLEYEQNPVEYRGRFNTFSNDKYIYSFIMFSDSATP